MILVVNVCVKSVEKCSKPAKVSESRTEGLLSG